MKKLIALYKTPSDPDAFMAHYRDKHLPLAMLVPGLLRAEMTLIDRTVTGEAGAHFLAELYFADEETFRVAMRSPENAAAGADLANFADGIVTVMLGTVVEP